MVTGQYDNPYWENYLPINQPIRPETDIDPFTKEPYVYVWFRDHCDLGNWLSGSNVEYRPRLRDSVQTHASLREAGDDEATELDQDSGDEYYDSAFHG